MSNLSARSARFRVSLASFACIALAGAFTLAPAHGQPPAEAPAPTDNAELQALCDADQADRKNTDAVNWHEVGERDAKREARVREMLETGLVNTGQDYFNAALICQHSMEVEGIQLAHELSMISASLGNKRARWLAAASYDRLLNRLDKPQRFGTQYVSKGDGPMKLADITPGVTDHMRKALNVPTLEQAKAREEEIRKSFEKPKEPAPKH